MITPHSKTAEFSWGPLLLGVGIMLGITVYPLLLVSANGKVNHTATLAFCWAMSAGITRGVGLMPKNRMARYLLSSSSCGLMLLLGLGLVYFAKS